MKSYTKPYASCRYTHPSVEAAIHLRNEYGLKASDIEYIDIKTYNLAVAGHEHTEIRGSYNAKMSIPYAVAVGLIYGKAGLQEFNEETVKDNKIQELTRKVRVFADKNLSEAFPKMQTAILSITTTKGIVTKRVDFPKGEPENPLTYDEFKNRYDMLMEYAGVTTANRDTIFDVIYTEKTSVKEIIEFL